MAIARPFAYNTGSPITGTEQVGNLSVGFPTAGFTATGLEWWNGPDEELGYVIACQVPADNQPTPVPGITGASVGFFRSSDLTEASFVGLTNQLFNQVFLTGDQCKTYLNNNGYWTSWGAIPAGMVLYLDTGVAASYPGSGSTWYDLSGYGNNGTIHGATYVGGTAAALSFNGTNTNYVDFASVDQIPIGNEPYTISVWFNSDEMPSNRGFIGWGAFGSVNQVNAWRLRDTGVSGFRHYWWGNDLDYTTPMSVGNWYNAIAAYENGSRKLYLNNSLVAQDTPTGHDVPYATNLKIGVTADFLNEWFKGKIAQVVIYKRQATTAEINAIWNSGKNRFGYSSQLVTSGLVIQLDANNSSSYPGSGTTVYNLQSGSYDHTLSGASYTVLSGVKCFDCNGSSALISVPEGTGPTLPATGYTYVTWARVKSSQANYRTLFRTKPNDHPILVEVGTDNLGFWDNDGAAFVDSGYDVTSIVDTWVQYAVVGDSSSSSFYINGSQVGSTVAYGAGGNTHWAWGGLGGQPFGYVANMYYYDRKLSLSEIQQNYNFLSPRF